ncbi:substrate-binding domain-containing protein, partial [Enterococcus faecalis]|uniref:substrate-binding domain-containing protein n=1 Tax=Enterococcus faecalis TaxID=1351 RepID=UPI0031CCFE69
IIGNDTVDMFDYVSPPLTTIPQPVFQLGKTTATLLLERIHQPAKDWEEQTLPVQLIERFSTARLK